MMTTDDNHVICPNCVHQFIAIPVSVQKLMLDAGFEPPFTHPPQRTEPICPECKAEVLYECVACSSNNYPPKRTEQEPYAYTYLGIKNDGSQHGPHLCWKPEYMDVMSHSKGAIALPLYTTPPQRTWVGLTDEEFESIAKRKPSWALFDFYRLIEAKLKEKNCL